MLPGSGAQPGVEAADIDAVDPEIRELLHLVAQRREAGRCVGGGKEFAGMGLEGHHAGGQLARSRSRFEPCHHGLVAEVHAVEIADCEAISPSACGGNVR